MPEPRGNADTQLRDYLLAAAVDLRQTFDVLRRRSGYRIEERRNGCGQSEWTPIASTRCWTAKRSRSPDSNCRLITRRPRRTAVIPPTHWNSAPTTCSGRSRRSSGAVGPNGARSNAPLVVRFELTLFGPQRWAQRAGLARRQLPRHIDLTLPRYAAPGDSSAVQTSRFRFSCRLVVGVVR